ncbi:OmpA family protein, partial [Shewanella algae]|uniref:OmpA family protein n=1 Tax=Shewanella algae TaxID=38313 RepID=UPI00319769DF
LQENPSLQIEIGGHTDNIGKPEDNNKLSTERAKSIANYIIGKGIAAERISFKGYGSTKPIADNKTEAGRAINRRTTVTITK